MPVKSVLDIEVNTAAFEKFNQQFQKYQDALAKGPKFWRDAAKEQKGSVASFQKMTENMQGLALMQRKLSDTYKTQNQHLTQGERLWGSMASHAKGIASSIISATRSMLSWTGIISAAGGLVGIGSVFGIDRLARAASDQRRSSMGLGLSIGEQKAFQINFGRAVDPDSFLSWVAQMESDPRKGAYASGIGVGLTGKTGADAVSMLDAIRSRALATDPRMRGMLPEMMHWEGVSGEDVRRLGAMSNQEYAGLKSGYAKDASNLNIPDKDAQRWQNFLKKLDEVTGSLFKTIEHGLLPLEPSLEKLSGAFEKFLTTLLKSDLVKDAINNLATWLDDFAGKISAPEFLASVERFTSDVGGLADGIHMLTHPGETISNAWSTDKEYFFPTAQGLTSDPRALQRHLGYLDTKGGLPSGFLETIKQLESSGNPNAVNVSSKGAAMGLYGFMPDTWKQFGGGGSPFNPVDASYAAERFGKHLNEHFHGDTAKSIAAWNAGEGAVDAAVSQAKGGDWRKYLPRESRQYLMNANPLMQAYGSNINVTVTVNTPPGSDLTATASAVAH